MKREQFLFGDKLQPIASYNDDKKREYIFLRWGGNRYAGYGEVATVVLNGEGFDENGTWVDNIGVVYTTSTFVPKNLIKKLNK